MISSSPVYILEIWPVQHFIENENGANYSMCDCDEKFFFFFQIDKNLTSVQFYIMSHYVRVRIIYYCYLLFYLRLPFACGFREFENHNFSQFFSCRFRTCEIVAYSRSVLE